MKELIDLFEFIDTIKQFSPEFTEVCASTEFPRPGMAKAIMYWANEEISVDEACPYEYWDLQEERGDGDKMEQWYVFKRKADKRYFVCWIYKGKIEEDFLREVRKTETLKSKWE
jgi:hypothetical protein